MKSSEIYQAGTNRTVVGLEAGRVRTMFRAASHASSVADFIFAFRETVERAREGAR